MNREKKTVEYGDRVMRSMLEDTGGVIGREKTRAMLESALVALEKQAKALAATDYDKALECPGCGAEVRARASAREVGQTAAYTAKVVDEIYRLTELAGGRADSRPEVGMGDLLQYISDEQLAQLMSWVEQAKARGVEKKITGGFLQ